MGNCFSESKMDEPTPAAEGEATEQHHEEEGEKEEETPVESGVFDDKKILCETPVKKTSGLLGRKNAEFLDKDQPEPNMHGKGPYEKFELSLPFARTLIKVFTWKVLKSEKECGGDGFVTI